MSGQVKNRWLPEELRRYVAAEAVPEGPLVARLRAETEARTDAPSMQIGADQARFMRVLYQLIGAQRVLEIGTFTGLSALAAAEAVGPAGQVVCLDISAEWTAIAQRYWAEAGVADRIDLRLGPALDTLQGMPATPAFDAAFIDADKTGYPAYLTEAVRLVRPGGMILLDNMFQSGRVADPSATDLACMAIRETTRAAMAHPRLDACLFPIGDGMMMARVL